MYEDISARVLLGKLNLVNQPNVRIVRNSTEIDTKSDNIVLDDIIHLRANEQICADGTLLEGKLSAKGMKVAIVAARFNEFITSKLLGGALDTLKRHGIDEENIDTAWVPGAFEIPVVAKKMAESKKYDAVICLGAVIRGSTSHYDYVCAEVSKGVAQVSMAAGIPVMFGILTTDTIEQAIERAGTKAGNKGYECALGAIEMVNLLKEI